jgi:hypothetical protein
LRPFFFRAEPLYENAATLPVGHKARALVRPVLVRNLEVVTPGAPIGSAKRGIVLAPGMAAARTTGRLLGAFVALAPAHWATVVAVASSLGWFTTAARMGAVAIAKHATQFPALLSGRCRFGRPRCNRPAEIAAGLGNDPSAKPLVQIFGLDFRDGAFSKRAEPERPEFNPDQAINLKVEMGEHVAHLAVFALTNREGEPYIRALFAFERCVNRPIMDAIDGDTIPQPVQIALADPAMGADPIAPDPTGVR